jgi:hypothetical protein
LTIEEESAAPPRHCEEERSDDAAIQRARKRAKTKCTQHLALNAAHFRARLPARSWIASLPSQ